MKMRISYLAVVALALMISSTANYAHAGFGPPLITGQELFTQPNGQYKITLTNDFDLGGCCSTPEGWTMFGFAVNNSSVTNNSTTRPGWNSTILNETQWNNGFNVGKSGGSLRLTNGFGDFATLFGSSNTLANVYWNFTGMSLAEIAGTTDVLPIDMDDRFFFTSPSANSNLVAFYGGGIVTQANIPVSTLPNTTISEPGTLAAFAVGLVGLGFMRRRRKLN